MGQRTGGLIGVAHDQQRALRLESSTGVIQEPSDQLTA
jgi:hypothetical protein